MNSKHQTFEETHQNISSYFEDAFQFHTQTQYVTWGKQALQALDSDNIAILAHVYSTMKHLGANINEKVNMEGYGNYVWTIWINDHLGDTILHLAIKQKLYKSIRFLLLHPETDLTIKNDAGISYYDLLPHLNEVKSSAMHDLLKCIDPRDYDRVIPTYNKKLIYSNVFKEARQLLFSNRVLYQLDTERMKFQNSTNKKEIRNKVHSYSVDSAVSKYSDVNML